MPMHALNNAFLNGRWLVSHLRHSTAVAGLCTVMAMATSACDQRTDGRTAGQQLDSAVEKTREGAAEVKANVDSAVATARQKIEQDAPGVEAKMKDLGQAASAKIDNATITAQVSAGLARDAEVRARDIQVDTANGTVTLKGSVPTAQAKERAAGIASAVQGVTTVNNQLVIAPPS